jgi:hypothetical protein
MSILNNKLQNNLSNIRGSSKDTKEIREFTKVSQHHFYPKSSDYEEESESDEIIERKRAWAELERE